MPDPKRTANSCCRRRENFSRRARGSAGLHVRAYCKLCRYASFEGLTDLKTGVKLNQRSKLFPIRGVRGPRGNYTPNNQSSSARLPRLGGVVAKGPARDILRMPLLRRIIRTVPLLAFTLACLASNAMATSCWCKILPEATLKSAGGIYYSWGRNAIVVQRYPETPCPETTLGVGITLNGPGVNAQDCIDFGGSRCAFPEVGAPNVPDGTAVYTITCKALDWTDWENGVNYFKYDTDSVSIVIDNTPPVVAITQAPPDGSTLPYTSFHVEGTVNDGSPIVSFQTESGVQISTNGSQWFVDFATAGEYTGAPPTTVVGGVPLSGQLDFSLTARDLVGNVVAVATSPAAPLAGVDPALKRVWYFDGLAPTVDFSSSSIGSLTQITSIRGTASDNYKLDKVQLSIKENSTGRYWNGSQFATELTTLTVPLSQAENSSWEYAGLDSDEMLSDSSYTVTATALDYLQSATVVSAVLTLATTFLGEGVVADIFNGSLVQFLVPTTPIPYFGLGESRTVCVHYSSPEIRNAVRFKAYPQESVDVWLQSQPNPDDPQCAPPNEILLIESIIPTKSNPNPARITRCDDHSEVRAYIGPQIVARVRFDMIMPKHEYSEIIGFHNDFNPQVTGLPPVDCPEGEPNCVGYQHLIYFEKGSTESRLLSLPQDPVIKERVETDLAQCSNVTVTRNAIGAYVGVGKYIAPDFNGYRAGKRFTVSCKDHKIQHFIIGKCVLGPVGIDQQIRVIGGANYIFVNRTDHNTNSDPYPLPPP